MTHALFDTHCHLQDRAFDGDFDAVVERARSAGVHGMLLLGYDERSNAAAIELASRHPSVFPAVGFHPHDADDVTAGSLATLAELAQLGEVVAVGEMGLDFYRNLSTPQNQRAVLDAQLGIALAAGKPVCVHTRSAEEAAIELLGPFATAWAAKYGSRPPGVMHCFGGTVEQAQPYVDAGFMVSIACAVTYPKNIETRRLAATLPLTVLVVETDSPYLPPQGRRGERNEPLHVRSAAEAIAAERGLGVDEVAAQTTANAERLFGVSVSAPALAGAR